MQRPHPAQGPAPQRIDLGQGKPRTVASSTSATISAAGGPASRSPANQTSPLPVSRASSWSFVRPVDRRKPSSACAARPRAAPCALPAASGFGPAAPRPSARAAAAWRRPRRRHRSAPPRQARPSRDAAGPRPPGLHPRGNFLGEEFDQEIGHRQGLSGTGGQPSAGPVAVEDDLAAGVDLVPGEAPAVGIERDHAVDPVGDVFLAQNGDRPRRPRDRHRWRRRRSSRTSRARRAAWRRDRSRGPRR
jgi:hypothetical protein